MSYEPGKVNWTAEEHEAAENADRLYETVHAAAADGFQTTDLLGVTAAWKPSHDLYTYLFGGEKADLARKLIALGTMLERDNRFLG